MLPVSLMPLSITIRASFGSLAACRLSTKSATDAVVEDVVDDDVV